MKFGPYTSRRNIKRGGEWIETRLLTSGPKTNPGFKNVVLEFKYEYIWLLIRI